MNFGVRHWNCSFNGGCWCLLALKRLGRRSDHINVKKMKRYFILLPCLALLYASVFGMAVSAEDNQVKIGVLAKRGPQLCVEMWEPTAQYLTSEVAGYSFEVVPLAFEEVFPAVENQDVDFILVNSALYVELEVNYGVSRIATLKNRGRIKTYTVFGGVIFCQSDRSDIKNLDDLKGKSFMAVDETSFGGWHMAWRELKASGINPYNDFTSLQFGGTHDAVVYAVRDGKVDAGTVRTDTLERMVAEGKIDLSEFYIINQQKTGDFLFVHSTRLYPEWPFAKTEHTPDNLAEKVAIALLSMSPDSPAATAGKCAGWTIPLNYEPVHECLKELSIGPYKGFGEIALIDVLKRYWHWFILATAALLLMVVTTMYVLKLNRKLNLSKLELEQANIRLQEMDRLKSIFLASMSHELRTPLNSIIGFTGVILQGMSGEVNERQREQLAVVRRNANHLLSLINDILDISRIEAGRAELSPEEFSLDDLVREVVETLSPAASEKGLELLPEVPEGITLFSDKRRMKQVLINLVSNAVKFTDQGSVKITARIPGDDNLEVRVIDTGAGIKQEDMDRLFQPFQQVDISLTKKHEGTGLGLYLTKKLTDLLGGAISAKSEYGKGSEFTFTLPLQYREEQK